MNSPTVKWGDRTITYDEAKAKAAEAKKIANGINLLTSEQRQWYEDSWTETVTDWFGIAMLIERVRAEAQTTSPIRG